MSGKGSKAWTPIANGAALAGTRRTGKGVDWVAALSNHSWVAPREGCWRIRGTGLYNKGTEGFLNSRDGLFLRGHSNDGPPWRAASKEEESTRVSLRAVPRPLLASHLAPRRRLQHSVSRGRCVYALAFELPQCYHLPPSSPAPPPHYYHQQHCHCMLIS